MVANENTICNKWNTVINGNKSSLLPIVINDVIKPVINGSKW